MNPDAVKGKDVQLYFYDNGQWKLLACATSVSLTLTTETKETSVTGTGDFATFEPTKHSYAGQIDGICNLDAPGMLTLPEIRGFQIAKRLMMCRFQRTSIGGSSYADEIKFYITESTDTGAFDGINTFSIALKGTGSLTIVNTATPINPSNVNRADFTTVGGINYVIFSGIPDSVDVLEVVLDGGGRSPIITSGTPVNQEVRTGTNAGDLTLTFPNVLDAGIPGYILYQLT